MDKSYQHLRAKLHRRREEESEVVGGGLIVRVVACLLAFLCLAGVRLYGGALTHTVCERVDTYMQGETALSGAYRESVEAFNQFCDRLIELQAEDD